ncbi:PRTRC system ThiF family protein [Rheinheimera hassiensis]|uniref:PRTRC system ThiF family protein n=1 Tax=Rheinheimera hassiensis TaxID=1193627 RepID=UPI001F05CA5A|nr:PRTRC system ThiF family protein [Rheinheimera hassiensis]
MANMISAPDFLSRAAQSSDSRIKVYVVGAGGTGSAVLGKLFQMHNTLVALGGAGLDVTVFDDDVVTPSNVGRQSFYPFDIGQNKAVTLVNRFNNFGGVNWTAVPERFNGQISNSAVIFGCVDNVASRKVIHTLLNSVPDGFRCRDGLLWIDTGNDRNSGNIVLGQNARVNGDFAYLPTVVDLYREQMENYVDTNIDSCSHAEALHKQDFGVNDMVAAYATQMLWQLVRHGSVAYQGVSVNLATGMTHSFEADPDVWAMYGYEAA